jgi:hypothetical protein
LLRAAIGPIAPSPGDPPMGLGTGGTQPADDIEVEVVLEQDCVLFDIMVAQETVDMAVEKWMHALRSPLTSFFDIRKLTFNLEFP